ncbi:DUF7282 domain-containing protein [Natrialbaceae archaeon A-gly3]
MSPGLTLGKIKRVVAILLAIAVVLAAGVIVGQAPELFGAEIDDPTADIEFGDQEGDGEAVEIANVSTSDGGFVVVTDTDGATLGVSEYLEAGTHESVTVESLETVDAEMLGQLTATVHRDTTGEETYAYAETDGEEDRPYLEAGFPVSDSAMVTPEDPNEVLDRRTFTVEPLEGPTNVTTDDTIEVTAEIENPTEFEISQAVEIRIGGEVYGQQVLTLAPGESGEVTFEVDAGNVGPGEYVYGVYTDGDGTLQELEIVYDGPATLEVLEAGAETVTVNAGLPEPGFVAVEGEEDLLGTSDELEAGDHTNLTVDLAEPAEEGEELTVTLYEGDPEDVEVATPFTVDDEPVEVTVTVESDENAEDGENDDE